MLRGLLRCSTLFLLLAFLGAPITHAGIIVDDKEWLQPLDVVNFTWNEFNAVCASGSCNGQVGGSGPDLTGWEWATAIQVGNFFSTLSGHPGGITTYHDPSLAPAIDFFDLGFTITTKPEQAINFGLSAVLGWTSTLAPSSTPYIGGVGISLGFPLSLPFGSEFFTDDNIFPADQADEILGAWLFRPTAVPLPGTVGLIVLGLLGLSGFRQRAKLGRQV